MYVFVAGKHQQKEEAQGVKRNHSDSREKPPFSIQDEILG